MLNVNNAFPFGIQYKDNTHIWIMQVFRKLFFKFFEKVLRLGIIENPLLAYPAFANKGFKKVKFSLLSKLPTQSSLSNEKTTTNRKVSNLSC